MRFWMGLLLICTLPALADDALTGREAAFAARAAQFDNRLADLFTAADKDASATLSREEAAAIPFVSQNFKAMDGNEDGEISREEMDGYIQRQKSAREAAFRQRQEGMAGRGIVAPPAETAAP